MNIKDKVAHIVQKKLTNFSCDLIKARHRFKDMTTEQKKQTYGHSQKSCQEILDHYENKVAELQSCLNWVASREN